MQKSFREKRREGEGLQEEELKYMFLDLLQRDSQFRTQVKGGKKDNGRKKKSKSKLKLKIKNNLTKY